MGESKEGIVRFFDAFQVLHVDIQFARSSTPYHALVAYACRSPNEHDRIWRPPDGIVDAFVQPEFVFGYRSIVRVHLREHFAIGERGPLGDRRLSHDVRDRCERCEDFEGERESVRPFIRIEFIEENPFANRFFVCDVVDVSHDRRFSGRDVPVYGDTHGVSSVDGSTALNGFFDRDTSKNERDTSKNERDTSEIERDHVRVHQRPGHDGVHRNSQTRRDPIFGGECESEGFGEVRVRDVVHAERADDDEHQSGEQGDLKAWMHVVGVVGVVVVYMDIFFYLGRPPPRV